MERGEIITALLGLGIGLIVGWFVWRFRSLSRDGISRLEGRLETSERRLSRSEKQRSDGEVQLGELEARLADERRVLDEVLAVAGGNVESTLSSAPVAGLERLDDAGRVDALSGRLTQSQSWLEDAEQRAESATHRAEESEKRLALTKDALIAADVEVQALTGMLGEREAALDNTKHSIALIQQQAQRASDTANGVIDLRGDAELETSGVLASSPAATLLAEKQAEVTELRSKVDSFEIGIDERSAASEQRLGAVEAQLATAQAALDIVGDAPERAAHLQDEVARLRALVADHSLERDRLGNQLTQRDQIDNKLDALFVEIHELRGRSAALRSGTSNKAK